MKHIVVTGISGGIGRELVKHLLNAVDFDGDDAYTVIGVYNRNKPNFEHRRFVATRVNVQDGDAVHAFAQDCAKGIWGVVNLAGAQLSGMHWKTSNADEANLVEANLLSTMNMCGSFAPILREQGAGRVVNISSIVAGMGGIGCSAYAASKAGIEGYTRSIALELARNKVTANCVALGYCNVGMIEAVPQEQRFSLAEKIPLGRFGTSADLAGLLLYLLSDDSAYMTGQTLHLNGGLHLG